jgi:hypothetical protein
VNRADWQPVRHCHAGYRKEVLENNYSCHFLRRTSQKAAGNIANSRLPKAQPGPVGEPDHADHGVAEWLDAARTARYTFYMLKNFFNKEDLLACH